jgi:hypothetical protein
MNFGSSMEIADLGFDSVVLVGSNFDGRFLAVGS